MKLSTVVVAALLAGANLVSAATIHVYSGGSIQNAINNSSNGDEILVHPGTYYEAINLLGKVIALRSTAGPELTTIDATGLNASTVEFKGTEGPNSVLEGFTITGGSGTLRYNSRYGGGIYLVSDSTVTGCIVRGNSSEYGGGIYCGPTSFVSFPTLTDLTIEANSASDEGGGMFIGDSDPKMRDCTISANWAVNNGGGLMFGNDNFTTMSNCSIHRNTAGGDGGGMFCVFSFNMQVTNCTFTENTAGDEGGGLYKDWDTYITLTNGIFWRNSDIGGMDESAQIHLAWSPNLTVNYCCVQGWTGTLVGTKNIDADPLFENPAGDDFHLTWLSPCINRGTNIGAPTVDIDGDPRPTMGTVDMGADEFTGDHALGADVFSLSASTGGMVYFFLFGGAPNGGRSYLMLGSLAGNAPGHPLPGGVTLPLNLDVFSTFVYNHVNNPVFQDFHGNLSWGSSTASAVLDTQGPVPNLAGRTAHFAFALEGAWDFASNPVVLEVLP